ncbi:hypothetical protein PV387_03465 [Streptomyces sp. ME02-6987-2C]|uniref:hypothetical protein n=1 Tax=unclassified Streptomyces TaxID=2593676 RepID=UPI0029B61F6A|nr:MULTISPECIES: hypothetical protein [unclassified Streptomyces]MDX3345898.1 hypothetical protein [Streptomyces sp. ME02-6979A]MDX3365093.1 hypothetical protein [Streptomyces sp. ME02-6987-2C]MDX3404852.1 hypothetical protein [Streptomyces sp. ME02-6977A]MDX3421664.1 hypothetical protein [Streptomyces sp. ME02-6985-2c]
MADPVWTAPLGHSTSSHRVHGYCSLCRGRTIAEELIAWQVHEQARYEAAQAASASAPDCQTADDPDDVPMPLVGDVSTRTYSCPTCGGEDAVLEATFLVTTKAAVHQVGRFAFCFACEQAQEVARA